jgi:hypothetical protein
MTGVVTGTVERVKKQRGVVGEPDGVGERERNGGERAAETGVGDIVSITTVFSPSATCTLRERGTLFTVYRTWSTVSRMSVSADGAVIRRIQATGARDVSAMTAIVSEPRESPVPGVCANTR